MNNFLDPKIIEEFREVINSSCIFYEQEQQKKRWNLVCTLLDRIDSAVAYLNAHSDRPSSEEEFLFMLVFASILKDGIYKFYESIYHQKPSTINNKKWFSSTTNHTRPLFTHDTCPTDDSFFEYIRSLAFAHPFETSQNRGDRKFMEKGEIHMSPWVMTSYLFTDKEVVGVRVYTNKEIERDILDILFPFKNLLSYIKERYLLINLFIKWGKETIDNQNQEWAKTKINRDQTPEGIIDEIKKVLKNRFYEAYSLDDVLYILKYKSTNSINDLSVSKIRKYFVDEINDLCDAVDKLDNEKLEDILSYLWKRPQNLHDHAHYELDKIFDYLPDDGKTFEPYSNAEWGMIQAKQFYDQYANKYVYIDFKKMSFKEIKLLIRVSCILGWQEDNKK